MVSTIPLKIPLEEQTSAAFDCKEGSSGQSSARRGKYGIYFSIVMMVGLVAFVAVKPNVGAQGTAENIVKLDLGCIEKRLSAGDSSFGAMRDCQMANGHSKIMSAWAGKFLAGKPMLSPAAKPIMSPRSPISRSNVPKMSHLSHVKLQLKDFDALKKSLEQMGHVVNIQENDTPLQVRSQKGNMENVDLVIKQANGYDIGFVKNDETYELVTDAMFWQQPIPQDFFLEKLKQKYAVNSIIKHSEEDGFKIQNMA